MNEEKHLSAAALHPEAASVVVARIALGNAPIFEVGAAAARTRQESANRTRPPGPTVRRVEDYALDTGAAALKLRIYADRESPPAIIVYLHGGGWVMGGIEDSDPHVRRIAQTTGCAVVSVNYRLAPENPFPAALEDASAALRWCEHNAPTLAGRPVPLVLQGDSAGGTIAAATALLVRDQGGPKVAMQILAYPPLGLDFDTPSYLANAENPILSRSDMIWFWDQYAPDGLSRASPLAVPLKAGSQTGLPPALIMTAQFDPLFDDGEVYAGRLLSAGVPTVLKRYEGMIHGFFKMADALETARQAHLDVADFIAARLEALA